MTGQLYSHLKFVNFPDRLQALREGRLAAPVHVRIKPVNRCNHNCWYCAYRYDDLQLGQDMVEQDVLPDAKMFEIVEDLVEMGVKAVTFSGGGEPLLYRKMPEVIERLAQGGIAIAALTNGSALSGRVAEAFARHGTWIRISIDAWDDESYAIGRRIKHGEFSRVIDNMRNFTRSGTRCVLGISFIVTKDNYAHIPEVCALFKSAGANHVSLSGVVVDNDGRTNNAYHAPFYAEVARKIAEVQETLVDSTFRITNYYHEIEERFEKPYHFCPFQQFQTIIGADAMVYSCHDKAYTARGALGSIKDRSFKDFWFSPECRDKVWAIDPARDCRHHCVAHKRNLMMTELLALDPDHAAFV
jgi:MoaA/NifB/PqqE/SkfB family radical SAM enzyme